MSDTESDYADSSSTDEEAQEEDLRKLKAVLEKDSFPIDFSSSPDSRVSSTAKEEYRKIQTALSYNKQTEEKLLRLERVLIVRLRECRQRLGEFQSSMNPRTSDKPQIFRSVYCGRPYFRDRDNFRPPDNDDTITMENAGMYDYSHVCSLAGWTMKDKSDFLEQIQKFSRLYRRDTLESKLADLRRISKRKDSKSVQKEIISLQKEINSVDKLPLNEDLVLPINEEYDWEGIANALNYRHSPEEYQSLWKLFLHPKINKNSWDKVEHTKLRQIAISHHLQDWDQIAAELNTGRTGYQCFVYYRTNMGNSVTGQKWTKEEEEYLRRLVEYYRENNYTPWGKVAASMENRTKIQVYNKYARLMELRKGRFLPEEDAVLLTGVEKFGPNFKKISKYVPGRSAAQLRTRYNVLSSSKNLSVVWTIEEDRKLIQVMANQDSSPNFNYANLTKFFPDKDRNQLRARYVTLVKFMKKHPNKDISRAPRRGARRLAHGKEEGDMNVAVENLKKRFRNEIAYKKSRKITKDSQEYVIEHGIIGFLITESVREGENKKLHPIDHDAFDSNDLNIVAESQANINETNLKKLLILLKAKLNKGMFVSSSYALRYPGLTQPDTESYHVKVKSYSKKAVTNVVSAGGHIDPSDVWGNNQLTTSNYVLPPNFSTITGCRKLMALASNNPLAKPASLHQLSNRNVLAKQQLILFMERFNTLFMWPLLLSNAPPTEQKDVNVVKTHVEKHVKRREHLSAPCGIIIPKTMSQMVHQTIDLPNTQTRDATVVKPKVGNDDFMYIDEVDDDYNIDTEDDGENDK